MRERRRPGNYPCQAILHMLKFQDVLDVIKGIAIVKSTANTSSCNSLGDSKRHIPANTTKVNNKYDKGQQQLVCEIRCLKC